MNATCCAAPGYNNGHACFIRSGNVCACVCHSTEDDLEKIRGELNALTKDQLIERYLKIKEWADALYAGWEKSSGAPDFSPPPTAFPWVGRRDGRSKPRLEKK